MQDYSPPKIICWWPGNSLEDRRHIPAKRKIHGVGAARRGTVNVFFLGG
jgi:hypothetical protein